MTVDLIVLALLICNFLLLLYAVRSGRVLGRKISRAETQVKKRLTVEQVEKVVNKSAKMNYQLLESLTQLFHILDFKEIIPATRGYATSPDFLLELSRIVRQSNPKMIVELGSGLSTLVIGKQISSQTTFLSIDHSVEYAKQTRELLNKHKVENARVLLAPLDLKTNWYQLDDLGNITGIELLVIDGPPQSVAPDARHPATYFLPKLAPNAIVVIDDANRDSERRLAEIFVERMPNHSLIFLKHEKGTAIISPLD